MTTKMTKHRTLPEHVVTKALQAHKQAHCDHAQHERVSTYSCAECGNEIDPLPELPADMPAPLRRIAERSLEWDRYTEEVEAWYQAAQERIEAGQVNVHHAKVAALKDPVIRAWVAAAQESYLGPDRGDGSRVYAGDTPAWVLELLPEW